MSMVVGKTLVTKVLAAVNEHVAAGNFDGPLQGSLMMLFTGEPILNGDMTLASFVEATFTGYARAALTWGSVLEEADGSAKLVSNLCNFRATDGVTPNTITGYAVLDSAGPPANVLAAEMFPSPIGVAAASEGVSIVGQFDYAGEDLGGAAFVL